VKYETDLPGWANNLLRQAVDEAVRYDHLRRGLTPKFGFARGKRPPAPPTLAHQPANTASADLSPKNPADVANARREASAHEARAQPAASDAVEEPAPTVSPDTNVVPLRVYDGTTIPGAHPDVLARGAMTPEQLRNYDRSFYGFEPYPWRR
jgi:hypothetical protein